MAITMLDPGYGYVSGAMQSWNLQEIDVQAHKPQVLGSDDEGRVIVLEIPAGEAMQEHQVHERAWLIVIRGKVQVLDADGGTLEAGEGTLAIFDPNESREVKATEDARLMLLLSPWPGEGHPSQR